MKEKILLRKTCSMYANDLHFATILFPYIVKEIENNATIKTILERNEKESIEKVIKNIGLNLETKQKAQEIDWQESDITKIRNNFENLKKEIKQNKKIDMVVLGSNIFIEKVNKAIDLWVKNNMDEVKENEVEINVINCFSFEENQKLDNILNTHDYILKTAGIEELAEEELLKAN